MKQVNLTETNIMEKHIYEKIEKLSKPKNREICADFVEVVKALAAHNAENLGIPKDDAVIIKHQLAVGADLIGLQSN